MPARTVVLARDGTGHSAVKSYLIALSTRRIPGTFQSAEMLLAVKGLEDPNVQIQPIRVIDGAINICVLRHEEHVVAYATLVDEPLNPGRLVLLNAFHERDWLSGLDQAESIARRVFQEDVS